MISVKNWFRLSRLLVSCKKNQSNIANLKVYNSVSKKLEPFKLNNPSALYWYSCGPTVYDESHIGHACCYMNFDIIRRILTHHFNVNVVMMMNITDIDDKIIKKANEENKSYNVISKTYEDKFFEDLGILNIKRPSIVLRVTEFIPQILNFIDKLVQSELAYVSPSGSVYFDSKKFPKTFLLPSKLDAFDSDTGDKRNSTDFALWKATKSSNEPFWVSKYGNGRPGWHIECSTLANIVFGRYLDFHSGGKDLMFPHHENEIIQCCAYHGIENWSSFWLHTGHLHLKGDVKMSKSLKNTILIKDLLKNYKSDEFRMFCLLSHYRYDKEFSDDKMAKPVRLLTTLKSFLEFTNNYCNAILTNQLVELSDVEILENLNKTQKKINEALCDDFNTSSALNDLLDLIAFINKAVKQCTFENQSSTNFQNYGALMAVNEYVQNTLSSFGLNLAMDKNSENDGSKSLKSVMEASLKLRNAIRALAKTETNPEARKKLLEACDVFRRELKEANITLKDYKTNTTWAMDK